MVAQFFIVIMIIVVFGLLGFVFFVIILCVQPLIVSACAIGSAKNAMLYLDVLKARCMDMLRFDEISIIMI